MYAQEPYHVCLMIWAGPCVKRRIRYRRINPDRASPDSHGTPTLLKAPALLPSFCLYQDHFYRNQRFAFHPRAFHKSMALGTTLPFWPALLFTYLEPISLSVLSVITSPPTNNTQRTWLECRVELPPRLRRTTTAHRAPQRTRRSPPTLLLAR